MVGRRLHWALRSRKGDYVGWCMCAVLGVPMPLTATHYESTALFETRQQARIIAKKHEALKGYQPVRVRVDLVEVL